MLRKTVITALLIGSSVVASNVMAADEAGWYAGASVGRSSVDIDTNKLVADAVAAGFATATATADTSGTAYKLFAGYKVNRNFAVEGGYTDLGSASLSMTTTGPVASVNGDYKATVWEVNAVGILPINDSFSVFGKLGYHWDDVKTTVAAISGGAGVTSNKDYSGNDFKFGVGAEYNINRNVGIRLEFERYSNVGNSSTSGGHDVDVASLGMAYRF